MQKPCGNIISQKTDNEREWIPNPQQTGVLEIKVTQEMVDTWLTVLDETGLVLQGKKLIPFWRGKPGTQGVNLRRVFTEPREIDPFLWFQGTAAAPYLEKGEMTDFANPEMWTRINRTFGRKQFLHAGILVQLSRRFRRGLHQAAIKQGRQLTGIEVCPDSDNAGPRLMRTPVAQGREFGTTTNGLQRMSLSGSGITVDNPFAAIN